jgi:SPP1 gp7 family putative phage head morphogenesis protein
MNSREYWLKREAEALKIRIIDEKEYQKEIDQIYQNMLDACQKEIESFYAKYANAEGISIAEAKKRVSKHDVKAFERKAAKYVKEKNFTKKANEELRLYNATMKINRLEMLKANIGLETIAGHDELDKFMAGILKGRTEDELKRQAGILGKTVLNNAAKANAIVNGSFKVAKVGDQSTFSDRIWQYQDNMRQDLGKLLQQGLIQGKNPRAITKDLRKYWYGNDPKTGGGAKYCMERLMRTELARVQTEAQKQSFIRNGFEHYEFIANRGCCPICSSLDGKHFEVAKMMPGENAPPVHPHCRCSTAAWEDDSEYEAWLNHLENGGTTESWNNYKKTVENYAKSSKMKYGLQFFARSSKDYKTIELPKQEYAHVMSELATHLTPTQRKQKVVTKAIGNYIYTIENNGFGNYRVIGKEVIDNDIFDWWEE